MRIIPDKVYVPMQCGASRLASGSGMVLPFVASRVPFSRITKKWRGFVMPGVILAPIVAGLYEPRSMFLIVVIWMVTAWKLGVCPHCRSAAREMETLEAGESE